MSNFIYPQESIYNLLTREEVIKVPRYMSKFREQVKLEKRVNKFPHKTMGPAKVDVPLATNFLQKHSNELKLPKIVQPVYMSKFREQVKLEERVNKSPNKTMLATNVLQKHSKELKLPKIVQPVSARTEKGLYTNKNFIKSNAIENIMSLPKIVQPVYVDTKKGDKQPLENSGLIPKFIKKKDYGQTPEYLLQRREEVRKAQEEYDNYVKEHMRGAMKEISAEERHHIIQVNIQMYSE
ncbi:unnamed protein product [Leuciscus chuanchicus]